MRTSILYTMFVSIFFAFGQLAALDNIVCKNWKGQNIYFYDTYNFEVYKNKFIQYARKHIQNDQLHMIGWRYLTTHFEDEAESIVNQIIGFIENGTITPHVVEQLYIHFQGSDSLKNKIEQAAKAKWTNLKLIHLDVEKILTQNHSQFAPTVLSQTLTPLHGTQTEHQACKYFAKIMVSLFNYQIKDKNPVVRKMLLDAFIKEIAEFKKGNYVFWHGRKYDWDYCAYVYKQLYNISLESNPVCDDYTFLRFDTSFSSWGGQSQDPLYMNAYLFGNVECFGHSTLHLVLSNSDWSGNLIHTFTDHYLCAQFNCERYYHKYQKEFETLKKLHAQANIHNIGNLLMIAIDKEHIDYVYSAGDWAGTEVPIRLSNGESTISAKEILQDLSTGNLSDFDHLQCVLPLTKEYALNPKNGPRIYSFNATDPEKRKLFEDYGAQLFAQIAHDITQDKAGFFKVYNES